jgi:type I restriction enzyme M protein
MDSITELPKEFINDISIKVKKLNDKYNITFSEITNDIKDNQNKLLSLINDLEGDDFDMKGLSELKSLLKGD